MDHLGDDSVLQRKASAKEIKDAQITMVEIAERKGVTRDELAGLISMITPTHEIPVTGITRMGVS